MRGASPLGSGPSGATVSPAGGHRTVDTTRTHIALYAVADDAVLVRLDAFEEYDPDDPDGSEYLRRRVRLAEPDLDAWVYVYNRDVAGRPRVESGDWRRHRASRHAVGAG